MRRTVACAASQPTTHRTNRLLRALFSTTTPIRSADNPIPANNPNPKPTHSPISKTNALPTSSEGSMDKPLQENPEDGEYMRVTQAPNRETTWSRSQQPREKAMVGPRFEQTIMEMQVRFFLSTLKARHMR